MRSLYPVAHQALVSEHRQLCLAEESLDPAVIILVLRFLLSTAAGSEPGCCAPAENEILKARRLDYFSEAPSTALKATRNDKEQRGL